MTSWGGIAAPTAASRLAAGAPKGSDEPEKCRLPVLLRDIVQRATVPQGVAKRH